MPVKVCLGGTFNVIHAGHLALLSRAFEEGDEVFVGLTSDRMARLERSVKVNDYRARLEKLAEALQGISIGKEYHIFEIDDEFGPAAGGDFDVIVVSHETLPGAERINRARADAGLKPLRVAVIGMVLDPEGGKLSASRMMQE